MGVPAAVAFVGHAIVSADGMISAADGTMPAALRNDADWRRFQAALDESALVVVGREGHRRHGNPGRRRLVFTGSVEGIAPDPLDGHATLYNPAGATLAELLAHLGIAEGIVAVTGGTRVFDAFLPLYDAFDLAEANGVVLPAGRPCFPAGHPRAVLAQAGLLPARFEMLDAAAGVTLTRWTR
jgi:hypothetical protein